MTRPILLWGLGMCALAAVGVVVFDPVGGRFPALMFGVGGVMVLLAAVLVLTGLGRNRPDALLSLPDVSPPTTVFATGVVLMAMGAAFGVWLVEIGGGVTLVGAGGLVREARAQRAAVRRARGGGG